MKPGTLYIVATPIGNLGDISLRAIETLKQVTLIAAEDTRHSRVLLAHYGITTAVTSLFDHNENQVAPRLLQQLKAGDSLALISDAGTPTIHDPGYVLVNQARAEAIAVVPIPGACAAISALCASGLPSYQFVFEGFLPTKTIARRTRLENLREESRTLVFYEAPHRLLATLQDLVACFGEQRHAVIARELTKRHESFYADKLSSLATQIGRDPYMEKGEIVILVQGQDPQTTVPATFLEAVRITHIIKEALPLSQAIALAAQITGVNKNQLYRAFHEVGGGI